MVPLDKHLDSSWGEFEQWIKNTIGSDFCWCIRPLDTTGSREVVVRHILNEIEQNKGFFLGEIHSLREHE